MKRPCFDAIILGMRFVTAALVFMMMNPWPIAAHGDDLPQGKSTPGVGGAAPQPASETPASKPSVDPEQWERYSRMIRKNFRHVDGSYVMVARWNSQFPSSLGKTIQQAKDENRSVALVDDGRGGKVEMITELLPEEADAICLPLPGIRVGEYGRIQSGHIREILGPKEMWIDLVWLINESDLAATHAQAVNDLETEKLQDQKNRVIVTHENNNQRVIVTRRSIGNVKEEVKLAIQHDFLHREKLATLQKTPEFVTGFIVKGISTQGLSAKTRWPAQESKSGVQLIIVGVRPLSGGAGRGGTGAFVAVPASVMATPMDDAQFKDMLAQRKVTAEQFIDMFEQERKADLKNFEINLVHKLDALDEPKPVTLKSEPSKAPGESAANSNAKKPHVTN